MNRAMRTIRREGFGAFARIAFARIRQRVFLREEHIWYELALAGDRPRRPMPEGFALRAATEADADAIAALPNQANADVLRERAGDGQVDLYVVSEDDKLAFACSIFSDRTPVAAAPGGWLELPGGTVCLEDSGASPDFRGRGVAPAAWSAIADGLHERGVERMVTKVAVDNEPSRRAVRKSGFQEAADVRVLRIGPTTRVAHTPLAAPGATFVIEFLARGGL